MKLANTQNLLMVLSIAGTFLVTSCKKHLHKEGSGVLQTVTRELEEFSEIEVDGTFTVHTFESSEFYVEITSDDNIISEVHTFVQDNRLMIEMDDDYLNYDFTLLQVRVYCPQFAVAELNGKIDFLMQDTVFGTNFLLNQNGSGFSSVLFSGSGLHLKTEGSGDVNAAGNTQFAHYEINGSGKIDALAMIAYDADAQINGSGKIYLHCDHVLNASIEGSGSIYYTGSPVVSSEIDGSGEVKPY